MGCWTCWGCPWWPGRLLGQAVCELVCRRLLVEMGLWGALDYFRSRGSYASELTLVMAGVGLSPFAGGLHNPAGISPANQGIIPVFGGPICPASSASPPGRDYPRWRGAYEPLSTMKLAQEGLSPLAGAYQALGCEPAWGIIPVWRGACKAASRKEINDLGLSPLAGDLPFFYCI